MPYVPTLKRVPLQKIGISEFNADDYRCGIIKHLTWGDAKLEGNSQWFRVMDVWREGSMCLRMNVEATNRGLELVSVNLGRERALIMKCPPLIIAR